MKKVRGFTLVELIIVFCVLALLVSVAVPSVISYIDSTDERKCAAMLTNIENMALAECKIDVTLKTEIAKNPTVLFDSIENGSSLRTDSCPCGGKYTAYYDNANDKIIVCCSYHTDSQPISTFQDKVKKTFDELYDKNKKKPSGSDLNKAFAAAFGTNGKLPTVEVDGVTYFVKANVPYGATEPIIFLTTNGNLTGNWTGMYFFDSENSQWYKSTTVHSYTKKPTEVSISKAEDFQAAIDNKLLVPTSDVF